MAHEGGGTPSREGHGPHAACVGFTHFLAATG